MIYWKKVEIDGYKDYTNKIIEYFYNTYLAKNIKTNIHNKLWNALPLEHIFLYFPELITSVERFGNIKEAAILLFTSDSNTIHIDHTTGLNNNVKARLNIPLLNTKGSITAFYNNLDNYPFDIGLGNTKNWGTNLKYKLTPVTCVEVSVPTILRISEPHTVLCEKNIFPRIVLTISFDEDIVKYLV